MAKKHTNWTRWGIPLAVLLVLGAWAMLLSPRTADRGEALTEEVSDKSGFVFQAGRHFGPVQLDSLVGLIKRIDPDGAACQWQLAEDSLYVVQAKGYPQARFRRIFLGQRSAADLKGTPGNPIRVVEGAREGYAAPILQVEGEDYAEVPYALLTGMLEELEGKTELREKEKK